MRVLFTTTPGRGHVHPMVPLAKAFLERGHEVAWAAADHVCAYLRGERFVAMACALPEGDAMAQFERRFASTSQAADEFLDAAAGARAGVGIAIGPRELG